MKCKRCVAGRFQNAEGRHTCKKCPGGKYSSLLGEHTIRGAVQCSRCTPGRFAGEVSGAVGAVSCTRCEPGKYGDNEAMKSCKGCPSGKFAPILNATSNLLAGAVECTSCQPGHYQNASAMAQCKICDLGRYFKLSASQVERCGVFLPILFHFKRFYYLYFWLTTNEFFTKPDKPESLKLSRQSSGHQLQDMFEGKVQ